MSEATSTKEKVIVVAPGRGTYNSAELGYLKRNHADKLGFIQGLDAYRKHNGLETISELDARENFALSTHATSVNASPLIYACSIADFMSIDRSRFDIQAVTGNSMGWYLALACAGAVSQDDGMHLVSTMGSLMQHHGEGGQILYPVVNEQWQFDPQLKANLDAAIQEVKGQPDHQVYESIHLGGFEVLAANKKALQALFKALPPVQERYPLILPNHSAFHCPMMREVAGMATQILSKDMFGIPDIPLIDGRGKIWQPHASSTDELYRYTLEDQVFDTYDYSAAIETGLKEFAPDRIIVLGPGTTLGAPTAQELIKHRWKGFESKSDFILAQKGEEPFVLAMGMDGQRDIALGCT